MSGNGVPPELIHSLNTDEGIAMLLLCIATRLGVTGEDMAYMCAAMVKARNDRERESQSF